MSLPLLFWMIYIIAFLFSGWTYWPANAQSARPFGATLIIFILIGLLGWAQFGAAVHK